MPRRRPDSVTEERHTLGDYERQQLSDIKWAIAAPGIGMLGAGAAIGAGIYFGAMFFNNTIDEVKDYVSGWWTENIGADDTTKAAIMDAVGSTTVEASTFVYTLPEWAEGMTVFAIYDLVKEWEGEIFEAQYNLWLTSQGIEHSFEHRKYWRINNRSGFTQRLSNSIDPEVGVSPFAYQLMIRETAARRRSGQAITGLVGAGGGVFGLAAGAVVWLAGDAIGALGDNWTGRHAETAPGFIDDPLLWVAWLRTDFPGFDANPLVANRPEIDRGLEYENNIHATRASDEDNRAMWPATPFTAYVNVPIPWTPGVPEDDPDFIGPPEAPPADDPGTEEYWRNRGEQPPPGWTPS